MVDKDAPERPPRMGGRVWKRCGCREPGTRRQRNAECPRLVELGHGTWSFRVFLPGQRKSAPVVAGGFGSQAEARAAMAEAWAYMLADDGAEGRVPVREWLALRMLDVRLDKASESMTDWHREAGAAVVAHLQHLRVRGLREQTVYNRTCALGRLAKYLGRPILDASYEELYTWQVARSSELTAAARRSELSHVREFFRWAMLEDLVTSDPTLRLPLPRTARSVPRPVSDKAIARALANAEPQMAAMLGLAAFAGLRACEIARLNWSEVSDEAIRVVDGKGGHGRLLPLCPALVDLLEALPHRRGNVVQRRDGRLGPVLPHSVSARTNEYLHSQGIPETLHQLRHRFGTATYRASKDLRAVQALMGHASPITTAGYAAADPESGREAVLAAGVLAS